jgi:HD-like signal output (HDOD) protein
MSTEVNVSIQPQILSPGEILLERISRNSDFPTFSKYITELNRKISSQAKYSSASDLSNTILKDYALTSKLLKSVNSAYYSTTGGKISTVTRAVVLLGYEKVRLATTNLLLFDLM